MIRECGNIEHVVSSVLTEGGFAGIAKIRKKKRGDNASSLWARCIRRCHGGTAKRRYLSNYLKSIAA